MILGSVGNMAGDYNPRRLFLLRTVVIICELAAILTTVYLLNIAIPIRPMIAVVACYAVFNLIVWLKWRSHGETSAIEFLLHLTIDTFALAALLYFAGGSTSPFVSLFLLPLVIAASTLPRQHTWAMAAITLACYTLLMFVHVPLLPQPDTQSGHVMHTTSSPGDFNLHVLGMWFSFLLGVGLILFFIVGMAEALRQRDRKLAEAREKHLRDEHLVALGTLAAGTAHELGTPLATISILSREMEQEHADNPELAEKIGILCSQVDRCKVSLRQISASAGQMKAESGRRENLKQFLCNCVERWQSLHPNTDMTTTCPDHTAPVIVADETLSQAILNILNNAAEASPEHIELSAHWDLDNLRLVVRDHGEGVSPAVLDTLGKPFVSTKKDGHGLGFYLAQEVIHRLGGTITIHNHKDDGASVCMELPLLKLLAEAS